MNLPHKADLERLIKGCVEGDRKCQQRIYEMFYGKMMGVCLRYTREREQAKDVLQDGFIKVYANIKHYSGNGSFEGWIRRIVVNTAIDYFRKNKNVHITVDSEYVSAMAGETVDDFEEGSLYNINTDDILREVQKLSPAYRTVFNLYVVEGYTHKEIAEKLGITIGTSKSNLAKAKNNLRKAFNKVTAT